MGHFWPKNQHSKFSLNCLIDFSEIVPDNSHLKEDKREGFGFLKKIFMTPKKGKWDIFRAKISIFGLCLNLYLKLYLMTDTKNG